MDPKGIFDFLGGWLNGAINKAEESGAPGPEKKESVLGRLLDFLGLDEWLQGIIMYFANLAIDFIVAQKNESGEFTHGK